MEIKFHPEFFKSFNKLFSSNPIYSIPRFFKDWRYEIKYAWQRVFRGYDDPWIWDIHSNLSDLMCKILPKLRKNVCGCPGEFFDKEKKNDEYWKWKEVLLKIEKGFKAAKRVDFADNWDLPKEEAIKKDEEDMKIFYEGMDLFKKYYFSLWD